MISKRKILYGMIMVFFILFLLYYLNIYYRIYLHESDERICIQTWKQLQMQEQLYTQTHTCIFYYKYSYIEFFKNSANKFQNNKSITKLMIDNLYKEKTNTTEYIVQNETTASKAEITPKPYNLEKDCILSIPDINLEKIVYTGKQREMHLKNYDLITADANMQYENGGNYIICGHASKLYGHSLNRIQEVKKGIKVQIQAKNKTEQYIVNKVEYKNMYETSQYCNQTSEKSLTIISCAKNISKESYIVIHARIIE